MAARSPSPWTSTQEVPVQLDELDVAILAALRSSPRAGVLEVSRLTRVARATVQARLQRLEREGVVTGYGPDVDLAAAGNPVQAFVTLEIAQGALEDVRDELERFPGVLEAYATTGVGDVLCRIAARDHAELQGVLLELNRSASVARSTSVMVLSVVIAPRVLPVLAAGAARSSGRAPAYRRTAEPS
jgi:DNA-binding Lrp family transcriptional regulator